FSLPSYFPGVRLSQPTVRLLDLESFFDGLAKYSVFVSEPIADGGNLQRRQRIDEACGEPPQAAVAQSSVWLRLDHLCPILAWIRLQILPNKFFNPEVDNVIDQRSADEKLHRQIVDLLGILLIVRLLRQQPALGEQVAQRASDCFEPLALISILLRNNVIEYEVPVVFVEVGSIGEP